MGAELTPESAEVLEEARGEDWDSGGGQESFLGSAGGQGLRACRGGGSLQVLVTASGVGAQGRGLKESQNGPREWGG